MTPASNLPALVLQFVTASVCLAVAFDSLQRRGGLTGMRLALACVSTSAAGGTFALMGAGLEPHASGAIAWHAGLRACMGYLGSGALGAAWVLVSRRPVRRLPLAAVILALGSALAVIGVVLALRMTPEQLARSAISWFPLAPSLRLFDTAVVVGASLSVLSAALWRLKSGARYGRRMLLLLVAMQGAVSLAYLVIRLFGSPSLMQLFGTLLTGGSAVVFWAALHDWRAAGVDDGVFDLFFRSLPVPALALDLHSDTAVLNPAAEALFGPRTSAQAAVRRLGFSTTPEALLTGNAGRRFPALQLEDAPGRVFELQVHFDARRDIGLLALFDVSERVEHAHELASTLADLRHMQERLVMNEKMAAIGVLVAGVSHEINNPLAYTSANLRALQSAVGGLLEGVALARRAGPAEEALAELRAWASRDDVREAELDALDALREASDGCARIQETVSSMRLLSRREEEDLPTDLAEIARAGLKIGRTSLAPAIEVSASVDGNLPIRGAAGELTRVVTNLIVNGGQALGATGRLAVRAFSEGGAAVVEVSDDGPGVAPELRARIFEPFFTTKAPGDGTGLGLAISYETARRHGGELVLVDRPGRGATFQLRVPLTVAGQRPASTDQSRRPARGRLPHAA